MDGVKRYWVPNGALDGEGWHQDDNEVVLAGEHDKAMAALREELAQVKKTSIVEIVALNGVIRRQSEELATAKRNEHNSEVAYKAAIEKQEELREELYQAKEARDAEILAGIRLQKKPDRRRAAECGADVDDR